MTGHSTPPTAPTDWADTTPPPEAHVINVPGYKGRDRREGYSQWRRAVHDRLNDGAKKMDMLRADMDANTKATADIKADTGEMLEIFRALKGALQVLNWVGKAAKPIGAIAMAAAALAGLWASFKGGGGPKL